MEDLIKRNDAIKAINNYYKDECFDVQSENGRRHDSKMLSRAMKAIPSARQTGGWKIFDADEIGLYNCQCSECGNKFFFPRIAVDPYDFCPKCGARMVGDNE